MPSLFKSVVLSVPRLVFECCILITSQNFVLYSDHLSKLCLHSFFCSLYNSSWA